MYQLKKILQISSRHKYNNFVQMHVQSTAKLCSFCRVSHLKPPQSVIYNTQCRHQSTVQFASLPIKKAKRKPKKYAELLEVTDNCTNNRKAAVRKFNASHLSLYVSQSNGSVGKLHTKPTKDNSTPIASYEFHADEPLELDPAITYSSKALLEPDSLENAPVTEESVSTNVAEDLETSGIFDPAAIIKNTSLMNSMENVAKELDEELEQSQKLTKHPKSSMKQGEGKITEASIAEAEVERLRNIQEQARRENLIRTLNAYLRVCITCGMMGRAYHTILHYREPARKSRKAIKDISLYNILIQAYAENGNLRKVQEIYQFIKDDALEPTAKTFAAVFHCYAHNHNANKPDLSLLYEVDDKMKQRGITFNDVLQESKYKFGQYYTVLETVKKLDPTFEPISIPRDNTYNCSLLTKLKPGTETCKSPAENLISKKELSQKFNEQINHETRGYVAIKSVEKIDASKPIVQRYRNEITILEKDWRVVVADAFDRDLVALKNREYKPIPNAIVLYPYLCVLPRNEYIEAIMREVRKLAEESETYSPSFLYLCRGLGKYINDKYDLLECEKRGYKKITEQVYHKYIDWYLERKKGMNSRLMWQKIADETSPNFALEHYHIQWPINLQISVGKFLYAIILKDMKLDGNCIKPKRPAKKIIPAFYTVFRTNSTKHLVEEIKPHPTLSKLYHESQQEILNFDPYMVPSECPPRPWTSMYTGGYMLMKTDLVRMPMYATEQWKRLSSVPEKQLWPSIDSLNQLGSIPWTVNKPILDIIIKLFQNGGSAKLNVPQPPSVLPPPPLLKENSTAEERKNIMKARLELRRKKGEMYSLWCDALYRLSLANHFQNKLFWLPHNMDFRGRVYPVPPHLNHLGSDLARSILIFATGKPLGPHGLDWLKIHTINLTGLKKREPLRKRLEYANEVLDKIVDSAFKPLTGEMWWADSEEPWQTLASCMEVAKALKSPNPAKYVCRFPVHQDGSCNGLQHYAALGRDTIGAKNVNLQPCDEPQDVYSSVAAMVEECRRRDAAEGNEIAQVLDGFIKRKVIKQTVMTTVYGVTKFGARLQIARQLKDIENFPQDYVWPGSMYLVEKTFDSLRSMFDSAKKIQDWFTDCARVVSTISGANTEWVTPLGLPVVQPYSKVAVVKRGLNDFSIDNLEKPNISKQKNAFAPNFVHSLDSCHMMLTSLHCEHAGISFVSVHDCYWTHPSTIDIMNKICREQFVALHSQPILENLSTFFIKRYITQMTNDSCNLEADLSKRKLIHTFRRVPQTGDFNLHKVLKSTYFFS